MDLRAGQEEIFRQVVLHRTMLSAYIYAIVRDSDLAEDTLSDVSVEIARSFEHFDASQPFAPWARGVARRVALANLRKRSALPKLLDTEMLDAVGAEMDALGDQKDLENRKQILRRCLDQLSEFGRRLVQLRYFENRSYPEIAEVLKRNANSLYVAFNRIHGALLVCVRRQEGLS